MASKDKDILTTAQTAKLLGVSTRTAQLLIEAGTVPSWKTPGGHRRVYRADVMAIIANEDRSQDFHASALVVVIGSQDRLDIYDSVFASVREFTLASFENVLAALVAVGSLKPYAIIVDAAQDGPDRGPLLRSLEANRSIADSRILAVGAAAEGSAEKSGRCLNVDTPEQALGAVLSSLSEAGVTPVPDIEEGIPIALNEGERLRAVERSGLLGTEPEDAFDRLTWLATQVLDAPVGLMTLLTASKQWFKSRVGLDLVETPRSWAFCNHTIMQRGVFVVEDLASDARFAENPAVAGSPGFRFYAGAPIVDEDGFVVGSLCVIDMTPRTLDARGKRILQELAAIASDELRLRSVSRPTRPGAPVSASVRRGASDQSTISANR